MKIKEFIEFCKETEIDENTEICIKVTENILKASDAVITNPEKNALYFGLAKEAEKLIEEGKGTEIERKSDKTDTGYTS